MSSHTSSSDVPLVTLVPVRSVKSSADPLSEDCAALTVLLEAAVPNDDRNNTPAYPPSWSMSTPSLLTADVPATVWSWTLISFTRAESSPDGIIGLTPLIKLLSDYLDLTPSTY